MNGLKTARGPAIACFGVALAWLGACSSHVDVGTSRDASTVEAADGGEGDAARSDGGTGPVGLRAVHDEWARAKR